MVSSDGWLSTGMRIEYERGPWGQQIRVTGALKSIEYTSALRRRQGAELRFWHLPLLLQRLRHHPDSPTWKTWRRKENCSLFLSHHPVAKSSEASSLRWLHQWGRWLMGAPPGPGGASYFGFLVKQCLQEHLWCIISWWHWRSWGWFFCSRIKQCSQLSSYYNKDESMLHSHSPQISQLPVNWYTLNRARVHWLMQKDVTFVDNCAVCLLLS